MNQLHASGNSIFKSKLKQDLKSQIRKIQTSETLSEEEKTINIATLKKAVQKKMNQSEFYNF